MAVIAGIDEAGYGPIIGPLVVSASVFHLPDASAGGDMWKLLAGAVSRKAVRNSPSVPVADSKSLHVRRDGCLHLERGVLPMLAELGSMPRSLKELLELLAPRALEQLGEYPWYAGRDLPLPRQADPGDLALRANGLSVAFDRRGVVLETIRAELVPAGTYNRLTAATRNKSVTLFSVTSRLIAEVFEARAAMEQTRILVDRQGGRIRYRAHLQRMFDGARIRILEESNTRSAYHVQLADRQAEIAFLTDAEDKALPVALASMVSKYLRELLMELLNTWWARHVPSLKPTAGYYSDGRRFLRDISPALEELGLNRSLLVRSR